jgi:hypothetical protein
VTTECGAWWYPYCTTRFSREATRNIPDGSVMAGIAMGAWCGPGAPICAAALAAAAAGMAFIAGRYYEDGDCLGIRWNRHSLLIPPTHNPQATAVRVKGGTYNCKIAEPAIDP